MKWNRIQPDLHIHLPVSLSTDQQKSQTTQIIDKQSFMELQILGLGYHFILVVAQVTTTAT